PLTAGIRSPRSIFAAPPPTTTYTLSLHDALPIYHLVPGLRQVPGTGHADHPTTKHQHAHCENPVAGGPPAFPAGSIGRHGQVYFLHSPVKTGILPAGSAIIQFHMPVRSRELDKIDRKILRILQEEGRISFTELGELVGLSTSPCTERVRRLEREGVITGYHARLDP